MVSRRRSVAVIHGIMSDEGATVGDVYVVPAAGGAARNVTPNLEGSARSVAWRADGRLLVDEYVDGGAAIVTIGSTGDPRSALWSGQQQVSCVSLASRADSVAAIVESFQKAPEGTPVRSVSGRSTSRSLKDTFCLWSS